MEVVAKRGFDATVDEIAQVSGVSARTIFRRYKSHGRLIVATVKDMFEACGRRANTLEGDLDGWLENLAITIHTRNAEIIGEAFWDIHAASPTASGTLVEVATLRRDFRRRGVKYLADLAWRTGGGWGETPESLTLAFALNFSAFTTQALMVDFGQTPRQIGILTADILTTMLRRAVEEQRLGGTAGQEPHPLARAPIK